MTDGDEMRRIHELLSLALTRMDDGNWSEARKLVKNARGYAENDME